MFPLTAFTTQTAAHLANLSVRQLRYWDRIGFYSPSYGDPETRRPHSRLYSFQDVVGLRAIGQLRRDGVSLQELRKVRKFFGLDATEQEWANRRFFTVGSKLYFSHQDAIVASMPLGQQVTPEILEIGPIVADVRASLRALQIREQGEIGRITSDKAIMSGVPVIAGTRIPVSTIVWFYRQGFRDEEILAEFPRLTREDIAAAVAVEATEGCSPAHRLAS